MILSQFILNPPNWNSSVKIKYIWQTAIKRGIQGNEQRSKLKSWPRRNITWQAQINTNYQRNLIIRKLFFDFQNIFGVPLWPYARQLTSAASIDDTIIYLDTTNNTFADNQIILITSNHVDYDYGIISSFDDTSITLTSGLTRDFVLGASVYPVLQGRISNNRFQALSQITGKISDVNLDFSESYELSQIFVPGSNDYSTYNGYYVLNNEPNWASNVELGLNKPFEVLNTIGIDTSYCYQLETDFSLKAKYTFYTASAINKFENFFNDIAGKYGSFWVPSWGNDFVITSAITNTDTTLSIENINYYSNWLNNDLIGRIIFIKYKSTEVFRKIISAPSAYSIQLDSAVGIDVSANELANIVSCFLLPVRFDQDELEMEYFNNEIAEAAIKFYSVNDSDMIPT